MSADGRVMAAAVTGGEIWLSLDAGITWLPRPQAGLAEAWSGLAMTADGKNIAACALGGYVVYSNDYGTRWTKTTNPDTRELWVDIASSS